MCWQSILTFAKDYPALATPAITGVIFVIFWFFKFTLGPKMYWLTCWNRAEKPTRWWHKINLHDWGEAEGDEQIHGQHELIGSFTYLVRYSYCKRCGFAKKRYYDRFNDHNRQSPKDDTGL